MSEQLEVIWSVLSEVSDRCAERTWKNLDDGITAPPDWPWEAARLEYRVFGIFLLSHALRHHEHSEEAWEAAMEYCVDEIEYADEFDGVAVEGNDVGAFIGARVDAYGGWSVQVREQGRQEDELQGWVGLLRNHLLASSSERPLLLDPPLAICDFVHGTILHARLVSSVANFYVPLFYAPVAHLCERHSNLLELPCEEVERLIAEGLRKSEAASQPKLRGWILAAIVLVASFTLVSVLAVAASWLAVAVLGDWARWPAFLVAVAGLVAGCGIINARRKQR